MIYNRGAMLVFSDERTPKLSRDDKSKNAYVVVLAMKVIIHEGSDGPVQEGRATECVLNNMSEPVVRSGGEPFKSCYEVEVCYYVNHVVDPSRSFVRPMRDMLESGCDSISLWPICDYLAVLIQDCGLEFLHPKKSDVLAFHTMFPYEAARCLAKSYYSISGFMPEYRDCMRVVNNPLFYRDAHSSERRLVEIADVNGFRYAVDRTVALPSPAALATEIAELNFGHIGKRTASRIVKKLDRVVTETYGDWGLVSNV